MSIILSLVGSRISDDCLTRYGYRHVVRISGKDLVRIFGTRTWVCRRAITAGASGFDSSIIRRERRIIHLYACISTVEPRIDTPLCQIESPSLLR